MKKGSKLNHLKSISISLGLISLWISFLVTWYTILFFYAYNTVYQTHVVSTGSEYEVSYVPGISHGEYVALVAISLVVHHVQGGTLAWRCVSFVLAKLDAFEFKRIILSYFV